MNLITKKQYILGIYTLILGILIGISAVVLDKFLIFFEQLFLKFHETSLFPVSTLISPTRRLLSVFVGGIIAALIWYFLQRKKRPTSIKQALTGEKMGFFTTIIHAFTQIFYVSVGGSVGRELAPRELGAMFAQKLTMLSPKTLTADDQKLLIAAAAGAGFAGVYLAPITGMLFCLELLYKKITPKAIIVSLPMAIIAASIGGLEKGFSPYYLISAKNFDLQLLPLAVILGTCMGIIGGVFRLWMQRAGQQKITSKKILISLPLIALLTGSVASFFPQIMGNGRGLAQMAFNSSLNTEHLIWLMCFGIMSKLVITCLSLYAGAYGGTLTPSIAAGACFGVLFALGYYQLFGQLYLPQIALIGAVGFLTASQHAPLMALFMLFEVCHLDTSAFLPLGLSACSAIFFAKVSENYLNNKKRSGM